MSRKFIERDGLRLSVADWARRLGFPPRRFQRLLWLGYSFDDIIAGRIRKQGQRTPEGEARSLAARTAHGHARDDKQTPEYRAWADMKNRCMNPNIRMYRYYGARGITVCPRWIESFDDFFADMGKRPEGRKGKILSLDRDATGVYLRGRKSDRARAP